MATNTQTIDGEWKNLIAQTKNRWHKLTEDDLRGVAGNIEELVGKVQQKTGEGRDVIEKFFSDITTRGKASISYASEEAGQYAERMGEKVQLEYNNARGVVKHHPLETVLSAFGIGIVAGLFLGLGSRGR